MLLKFIIGCVSYQSCMNENQVETKDINVDLLLDIEGASWSKSHVLDCMVTRGIAINAKEGDCWKLQLEQLLCFHWCQTLWVRHLLIV